MRVNDTPVSWERLILARPQPHDSGRNSYRQSQSQKQEKSMAQLGIISF